MRREREREEDTQRIANAYNRHIIFGPHTNTVAGISRVDAKVYFSMSHESGQST